MTTIREEIKRRLQSNQVYYAHFVTTDDMQVIAHVTTNDIVKVFDQLIDELYTTGKLGSDSSATNVYNIIKEELRK